MRRSTRFHLMGRNDLDSHEDGWGSGWALG
ncbi:MAG: hypothetical protein RL487_1378, partial [Actinomycetota bacterium]